MMYLEVFRPWFESSTDAQGISRVFSSTYPLGNVVPQSMRKRILDNAGPGQYVVVALVEGRFHFSVVIEVPHGKNNAN